MGTSGGKHGGRGAFGAPTTARRLVRSADQLDILVELFDAEVSDGRGHAERARPRDAAHIRVPAHRRAHLRRHRADTADRHNGVNHIAAGVSVVVVPVTGPFPFTVDGVLGAAAGTDGLAAQATEGEPDGSVTAVEAPAGLWLSPVAPARLVSARQPFTTGDTTEVWTARLEPTGDAAPLDVAAIDHSPDELLVTQVPDGPARGDIVKSTSTPPNEQAEATDAPLSARRLWLSSSGAFADLHGEWETGGIALYDHLMAAGRDVHVEFQSVGYLLPFGHRAAIADVAGASFLDDEGGGPDRGDAGHQLPGHPRPRRHQASRAGARLEGRGLPFAQLTASTSESTPIRPGLRRRAAAGDRRRVRHKGRRLQRRRPHGRLPGRRPRRQPRVVLAAGDLHRRVEVPTRPAADRPARCVIAVANAEAGAPAGGSTSAASG